MRQRGQPTYPVYLFDVEQGVLYFNTFGRRWPKMRQRREIASVLAYLKSEDRAGRIDDALVVGWPGSGIKPLNAIDVGDEAAMAPWRARAFVVNLRVAADGEPTITRALAETSRQR
jgi:hypothetical protein